MQNNNVVITNALRTAVGSLGKSLKNIPAPNLSAKVISSLLKDSGIKNNEIDEIILGQVLTGNAGQNPLLFFAEIFPFKTTGSFFTTGNATFIFFIIAIIVSLSKQHSN